MNYMIAPFEEQHDQYGIPAHRFLLHGAMRAKIRQWWSADLAEPTVHLDMQCICEISGRHQATSLLHKALLGHGIRVRYQSYSPFSEITLSNLNDKYSMNPGTIPWHGCSVGADTPGPGFRQVPSAVRVGDVTGVGEIGGEAEVVDRD
ncbi:hypothetical protein NDU88_005096 [Pleurodeles waltl]|uniref:Uncharacterized protein n=1 Tax=Pleurodeles waltl TaxID=8319 RepID=A0AAV7NMY9_PLEWA|nr:hypothetical protein NDU88_005096 [Pleurodeles waltl]